LARPVKPRMVSFLPPAPCFVPQTAPFYGPEAVTLGLDEWEALRLKDYLGMEQEECASLMGVAQSSLQRILASARSKLACALVEGKAINIQGGTYRIVGRGYCRRCRHEWGFPADNGSREHWYCPSCGSGNIGRRGLGHGHGNGGPPWGRRPQD